MHCGILANQNSTNHPYCFLSNQREVQILAFLHVIYERIVSCPPPKNGIIGGYSIPNERLSYTIGT